MPLNLNTINKSMFVIVTLWLLVTAFESLMWSILGLSAAAEDEIWVGTLISGQEEWPQGIESSLIIAAWETAWRMMVNMWCIRKDASEEVSTGNMDAFHLMGQ